MKPIPYKAESMDDMPIEERNQLVLAYLWCIDFVIHQNHLLLELAHIDRDDVYQFLAVRLIRAGNCT